MTGKVQVPFELLNQDRLEAVPVGERAHRLAYIGRAAASGDEGALEKLLRSLAPDMLRVIRVVLGRGLGGGGALDRLLQASILDFVGALGQFRNDGCVAGFALSLAFRHALAARRQAHGDDGPAASLARSSDPEPFPELESRRAVVADLLTVIPPLQAEALGLRLVVGLSIDEIARATDTPAVTVRSRLRVAKESLRLALEQDPDLRASLALEPAS